MKPLSFSSTLSRTDSAEVINAKHWGRLSFLWTADGIRVQGTAALDGASFESIDFDDDEGIAVARRLDQRGAPLYIINLDGDVAQNYDEVTGIVEDDGFRYIVAYKKRIARRIIHLRELYLIDAEDMRSTNAKYGKPTAYGIHSDFCEIHHGIMVLKVHGDQYKFNAIHKYPGSFNHDSKYSSYEFKDGYRWRVNMGTDKEEPLDFTSKMKGYHSNQNAIRQHDFKYLLVHAANHPIERNVTKTIRVPLGSYKDNEGILVVKEGKNKCDLVRCNGGVWMPIEKTYTLDSPLPKVSGVFHSKSFPYPESIVIPQDVNITELVSKLINDINEAVERERREVLGVAPFIPAEISNKSLLQVFENSLALIEQGWFTAPNGQRVDLNVNKNLAEETIVYKEQIVNEKQTNCFNTQIEVRHIDCLDMAKEFVQEMGSGRVAVLNMANSRNPVARVTHGAPEQEAYLMRCSDYYNALVNHMDAYPIRGDHMGIYTPGVTVFRNSDYQMADEPWKVNIIAVSGIHRPDTSDGDVFVSYTLGFLNKIRTILRIATAHGQTNLVLGAMGCGGLDNIPRTIAKMFRSVLSENEFSGAFEHIVFAMLPVEGEDETFDAFRAEFPEEDTQVEVQEEVSQPEAQEEVAQPEVPEEVTPEENEILQTLKKEYTAPPFRVDGTLTLEQRMRMIRLIDKKQLNENSARDVLGVHLIEALFLLAGWLRNQNHGIRKLNLDYLILEKYVGNQQELDEDDQLKLGDIEISFYDELSDPQGASAAKLFSELKDRYQDDELAELFVANGYIRAVQEINREQQN